MANWSIVKYDYVSLNCIYKGGNVASDALESSDSWTIVKYDYDGNDNCIMKRLKTGSWTLRAEGW